MPIYEYLCAGCGSDFELQRSMAEREAPAACPVCHSRRTTRRLATFAAFGSGENGRRALGAGCGGCKPTAAGCAACGIRR